jgi:hypothetical protein
MKKIKIQRIIFSLLIALFASAIQPCLYGQDTLSKERENEIKTSGKYYWGEGADFEEFIAKLTATEDLSNHIFKDVILQTAQQDEILKTVDARQQFGRLQQQGKNKFLAWIAKDSVFITIQRPITQISASKPQQTALEYTAEQPVRTNEILPAATPTLQSESVVAPEAELTRVTANNPVLQTLAGCKTYRDVKRIATMNGLVRGEIGKGSTGFSNPENCIIAVFTSDGALSALLDNGNDSRTDLLSGNTIQNPEQFYNSGQYYLWYMQVKKAPYSEARNTKNNTDYFNGSSQVSPPIENTNRYANASILLPVDWDGKSVLANEFVWIDLEDKILQNKYHIHPGDEYGFYDDHETWDDDNTFYKYPLSPNVIIDAGVWIENNSTFKTRRMTVNEFANYMRSLGYAIEGENNDGIAANITYKNGMITKIVEVYTP